MQTLLLIIILICSFIFLEGNLVKSQYEALKSLYESTDGENWLFRPPGAIWNFSDPSSDPCSTTNPWQGVKCLHISEGVDNFVTTLVLVNYGLNGTIPSSIGDLSNLDVLNLDSNYLRGTIPEYFEKILNLRFMHLSNNNLRGTIPSSIGNLSNLFSLRLFLNDLSGTIPSSFGNQSNLIVLHLMSNNLSGTIPSSIGDLSKLTDFDLFDNHLSGKIPSSIGNLSNLFGLRLFFNDLTGTIPSSIGNLSKLTDFVLFDNHLSGTIPSSFGNLSNLIVLLLMSNDLTGTIPSSIGNLSKLTDFGLTDNHLSGTIPSSIGNLSNLEFLTLDNNRLSGTIPSSIGNLSNLEFLTLDNNRLSGTIPSSIGNLFNMEEMYLDRNDLRGTIPESICNLTNLIELDLDQNTLSGTIPESIGNLLKLFRLRLQENHLKGTIPESIGNLSNLVSVYLYTNYLSGTIPPSISNLSKLEELGLFENKLSGTIPSSFGNLSKLTRIYLSDNHLNGIIPDSIGDLSNLEWLALYNNHITGTIPSSLGDLSKLEYLDLSVNMLESVLPNGFGKLKGLKLVFLQQNKLSGLIVPLTSPVLEIYDVRSNIFTGQIPSSLFALKSLKTVSFSDNCLSLDLSHITECDLTSTIEEIFLIGIGQNDRCKLKSNNIFHATHSVPDCIWRMKSLKQLYITGNGLKGNLDSFNLPNISELSISSNRLSGTLPAFFQSNHSLKVFDIADNRFEGYLDVNINSTGESGNMIKADVNRFSGRLNTETIKTFDDITVLTGNLISCATLPSEDSGLDTYICDRRPPNSSSRLLSILEWIDYPQNLIQFHTSLSDHVKQSVPLTVQFIQALYKLLKLSFFIFIFLIFITITIYSGFKLGEGSEEFKSHTDQYLYLVSGVYLRSAGPACTLFVVYVVFFVFLVFVLNRLFVIDWITRSSVLFFDKVIQSHKKSTKNMFAIDFVQSLACLIFIGISLFTNALYIYLVTRLNGTQLVLVQLVYSLFNILYEKFGISLLFDHFFDMEYGHTASSSFMYTFILIFVDMINPCIAIIFTDDLCFKQLFFTKEDISVSYGVTRCNTIDTDTQTCTHSTTWEESYTVPLPFIFSDQCRNAMFRNFIPTILYTCVYSTFVFPSYYLWCTYRIKSLNDELSIFGFKINMRTWVLNDVTNSFVAIVVELMLLLFYGIVSPFCAVALWVSTASRILLLRLRVYRYYLLQFGLSIYDSRIDSVVVHDKNHIEVMCGTALKHSHIIIQPIFLLSLIFGLYLFEMAYDGENGSVTVSICLLVLITCTTLLVQNLIIWSRRTRLVSTQKNVELELNVGPSDNKNDNFIKSPLHGI